MFNFHGLLREFLTTVVPKRSLILMVTINTYFLCFFTPLNLICLQIWIAIATVIWQTSVTFYLMITERKPLAIRILRYFLLIYHQHGDSRTNNHNYILLDFLQKKKKKATTWNEPHEIQVRCHFQAKIILTVHSSCLMWTTTWILRVIIQHQTQHY